MADSASETFWNAMSTLLSEIIDGPAEQEAWMLNPRDLGLLRSLDLITASAASVQHANGSSIASHVDHLRYGLHLLNQWSEGKDAFATTDYAASWHRDTVTDAEWRTLREQLRAEAERWRGTLLHPRPVTVAELTGVLASIAHLAYHLGAIRQMDRTTRGPQARD
jgi:hypothetical protein